MRNWEIVRGLDWNTSFLGFVPLAVYLTRLPRVTEVVLGLHIGPLDADIGLRRYHDEEGE